MSAPPPPPTQSTTSKPVKKWTVEMHAAAQGGDLTKLKELLNLHQSDVATYINVKDDDTWSPLHYSSWYGHIEVVKELLKLSVDVNAKNGNGSTPLHYAAGCGQIEIVKLLLAHGADKSIKDNEKNTPLQLSKQLQPNGWQEIVSLLEQ